MNIIRTMSFLFYSTDYGKLYINKITKIACDKLGAENRRGTKTHTILVFDKKILSKTAKIYRSDRRINTKSVEIQDDAPDARDTSWMDREPFHIAKEDDHRNFFSVINPEDNKGETDTVFKNDSADPLNASPVSSASLDYPTDCYYCDQMFTGSVIQDWRILICMV